MDLRKALTVRCDLLVCFPLIQITAKLFASALNPLLAILPFTAHLFVCCQETEEA